MVKHIQFRDFITGLIIITVPAIFFIILGYGLSYVLRIIGYLPYEYHSRTFSGNYNIEIYEGPGGIIGYFMYGCLFVSAILLIAIVSTYIVRFLASLGHYYRMFK
ncbi:hypothetical protein D3C78_1227700 [compost metagenome]